MRSRLRQRPLAAAAGGLVAVEAAFAALGRPLPLLSLLVLTLAPGLALAPLLPRRVRDSGLALLAAAPLLGSAAMSVALVSASAAGLPLDDVGPRVLAIALVALGLALGRGADWPGQLRRAETAGFGLALAAGVLLERRVLGELPVPGNDWGKYLLYADEIRRQGELLIDNPFWMLGVPFREDPGTPALYGAFLRLADVDAAVLAQGIWAFALMLVLGAFLLGRSVGGPIAGVLAAALIAVSPISHDMLAWLGLANLAALALLALLVVYLMGLAETGLDWREAGGAAILLVAIAAAHRLTFGVALATAALAVAAGLTGGQRRHVVAAAGRVAAATAAICAGVAYDLIERGRTFGGTQDHTAYLSAKADLWLIAKDLGLVLAALGVGGLVWAVARVRREPRLAPLLGLFAVTAGLAYAWVVELPLAYFRMAYYLPLVLAPLAAAALVAWLGPRRGAIAGAVAALAVGAFAWPQARDVRDFYAFASDASLRGLDAVAADLRPGEVVVTDRCWSFLATWLLHTPTLAALEPEDIQPRAELARAREAREILAGTARGRALARRLGVRYLLVAPTCTDARERPARPPVVGEPVFVSQRLAILRLPGRTR